MGGGQWERGQWGAPSTHARSSRLCTGRPPPPTHTPTPHTHTYPTTITLAHHARAQVQRSTRLCVVRDLSEHDIVSRIMRKENYLIGMLNKVRMPGCARVLFLCSRHLMKAQLQPGRATSNGGVLAAPLTSTRPATEPHAGCAGAERAGAGAAGPRDAHQDARVEPLLVSVACVC